MPLVQLGAFVFSSGWNPNVIGGPMREAHVIEHAIPGLEGGVTEYLGSKQNKLQLRGFFAPPQGAVAGTAGAVLSGPGYVALTADACRNEIIASGFSNLPQALLIESTLTPFSGLSVLYENDFYYIENATIGYEAGRSHPYYPYTLDLKKHRKILYGNSSGLGALSFAAGEYFSGYIRTFILASGTARPRGEYIVGAGIYFPTAASGNAKVAIFTTLGALQAESATRGVVSGWNYFQFRPGFTSTSGATYDVAFKGDATSTSGYTVGGYDRTSGVESYQSGITYSNAFPATLAAGTFLDVSGRNFATVMVA